MAYPRPKINRASWPFNLLDPCFFWGNSGLESRRPQFPLGRKKNRQNRSMAASPFQLTELGLRSAKRKIGSPTLQPVVEYMEESSPARGTHTFHPKVTGPWWLTVRGSMMLPVCGKAHPPKNSGARSLG